MNERIGGPGLASRLAGLSSRSEDGFTRTVEVLDIGSGAVAYELSPAGTPQLGLVLCPSFFELKTLQSSEMRLAEAAAGRGHHALYVQPPGTGESYGAPEDVRFASRVEVALGAARRSLSEGRCLEIVFFGSRLGGAVAVRAAQELGARYAAWDPVLEGPGYLKQARRLDRIAAMAGRRKGYEPMEVQLKSRGWATLLGNVVTQAIFDDLSEVALGPEPGPVSRGFAVTLSDASRDDAEAVLAPFTQQLRVASLGRKHLGHLGFAPDDASASIPLTLDWLEENDAS